MQLAQAVRSVSLADSGIVAALLGTVAGGTHVPLHLFNALLAIGIIAGLVWLLPPAVMQLAKPMLADLLRKELDARGEEYEQGMRDMLDGVGRLNGSVIPMPRQG